MRSCELVLSAKPVKVFPLFSRSKPPITTHPPPQEAPSTFSPSQPIEFLRSDETFLRALETSKPPPAKSRVKQWKSAPSNSGKSTGLTVEDPIILDLPPTRTRSLPVKTKLFDSRAPFKLKSKQGFGSLDAPLPDGNAQHIRGSQSEFGTTNADTPFHRKSRDPIATTSVGESPALSLAGILNYPQGPSIPSSRYSPPTPPTPFEIPAEYLIKHPVFRIFTETADPPDVKEHTTDLWVDKWAPCLAEHVLGNEGHALYLRDWLKASEIGSFSGFVNPSAAYTSASSTQPKRKPPAKRGTKRPRIRREVGIKKAKKRRRKGDWIVDDDCMSESSEMESHPLDSYLDDDDLTSDAPVFDEVPLEAEAPAIDLPPLAYDRPNAFDMSNTIILCGPSGSGKTAAVYACAAELDWEVFEVYPGVGRRSGTALDNLIGQVGRNHLVTQQGGRPPSPVPKNNALARFFGPSATQIPAEPCLVDGFPDGIDIPDIGGIEIISDDGNGVPAQPQEADPQTVTEPVQELQAQAKQSLILLEEVDILYRDDVNFWQTVINIIRDCRRPVVLTCNGTWCTLCYGLCPDTLRPDVNLLPLDQLPVQKILSFTRPPTSVVTAYTSAICCAEGTQPDEHFFALLTGSVVDLRWCINQCQLGMSLGSPATTHLQETFRDKWKDSLDKCVCFPEWELPLGDESQHRAQFRRLAIHTDNTSYLDSRLVLRVDTVS